MKTAGYVGIYILSLCTGLGEEVRTPTLPAPLASALDTFTRAVAAFDIAAILEVYAEDFISGTGRSKAGVRQVLHQLRRSRVRLTVEKTEVEAVESSEARVKTYFRIRYVDHFEGVGAGEVVITDVVVLFFRQSAGGWKIHTDDRVATYREGRYGGASPNVVLEVPDALPIDPHYPVTIHVQRQPGLDYRIAVGNYPEDPGVVPQPDIVTGLSRDGVLQINLIRNPRGVNEMVRVTVIAEDRPGDRVGATTVSKLVPGSRPSRPSGVPPAV